MLFNRMDLSGFTSLFKKTETPTPIPINGESAAVGLTVFGNADWPEYNPDTLIGRQGTEIYKRMMIDEQVKAVVRIRRNAVTGRSWRFEDNDSLSKEENKRRADLLTHIVNIMPGSFKTRLDMIMSAMYSGFSMTEKVFDFVEFEGKMYIGIKALRLKPFATFEFFTNEYGKLLKVQQFVNGKIYKLRMEKFIHFVYNPEINENYGQSELREAYRSWFSKDIIMKMYNMYLERCGSGVVVVTPKSGTTLLAGSATYNQLVVALDNLKTSTSLILPSNLEFNIHTFQHTDAYDKAIGMHNTAISKSLLMPDLLGFSERGKSGSRALGDTQLEAFLWMLDAEALTLGETLNEQLFKQLAELNFPDGLFPKFVFNDLSDTATQKLITNYKELVGVGAVTTTDQDEKHLKGILGFPEEDEKDADTKVTTIGKDSALDGGQIDSLLAIIDKVAKEQIPRETGIEIIVASFPISREEADILMDKVGNGFEPKPEEGMEEEEDEEDGGGSSEDDGVPGSGGANSDTDDSGLHGEDKKKKKPGEESLIGIQLKEAAFTIALKRMDFAGISRKSDVILTTSANAIESANSKAIETMLNSMDRLKVTSPKAVEKIMYPTENLAAVKRHSKKMLKVSWALGREEGKRELERSKKVKFIQSEVFVSLETIASQWFKTQSFTIAGDLANDVTKVFHREITNGILNNKSLDEIKELIVLSFASEGLADVSSLEDALGEALSPDAAGKIVNGRHRIETIVRNNTFTAINKARFSLFSDPSLDGFVEALQYSAIMDSRVTDICKNLDDKVFSLDSNEWKTYQPPNHHNCRSILVPVTELDVWEASDSPTVDPQKGFK